MGKTLREINIEDLNPAKKISRSGVRNIALLAAKSVRAARYRINIVFVSDSRIRAYNRKYLGRDRATDVLAFPDDEGSYILSAEKEKVLSGDIAISSDRAYKNAGIYGVTFREEIDRYVAHGILHLAGYTDTCPSDRRKMGEKEDEIIRKDRKKIRK
jgi:probable rRNA maturation factor